MTDDDDWENRLASLWEQRERFEEQSFLDAMDRLTAELPADDPRAPFERAGAFDAAGHEDAAVPLYRRALAAGLTGPRRRQAIIQLASSLRNLGRPAEGVELLIAERSHQSDDLDDAVAAFLALALADSGREREAVSVALGALAPHLHRYQRSVSGYARELTRIPDSRPRPEPVIRPFRPSDADSVRRLLTAAFGRASVATLAEELRTSDAHRAALVAEASNEVIGCVQLCRGWLDAPSELVEVLVLSPLGVLPELHGRGIGTALVRAAIATAAELGPALLFLEGSPRYYPRFGFQPAGPLGFLRPSVRIPEPAFQVITLPSWQPWMVGALVYPETFWRHDAVGLRKQA